MAFPVTRLRRLRRTAELRNMVVETRLTPDAFVYPMFVCPGERVRREVRSMPGVFNLSVDEAVKEAREVHSLGVPAIILFGLPETKDEVATGAWSDDGIVQRATRFIKTEIPELLVLGDVCLCEYMSHGHCGVVRPAGTDAVTAAMEEVVAGFESNYGGKPYAVAIKRAAQTVASRNPRVEYEIANDASLE